MAHSIMIHGKGSNSQLIQQLKLEGVPFILLDRIYEDIEADAVVNDNLQGASQVMHYLFDNDHCRIGLLTYPMKSFSPRIDRLKGYKQALQERNIPMMRD
jgi:DNA-binding LacI/PurR family transcriptional regulator